MALGVAKMMEVKTNVFQDAGVRFLFTQAPEQYRRSLLGWLIRERGSFVGDKNKDGAFTRTIQGKALSSGQGHWDRRIARAFKGYIDQPSRIEGMTLRMGMNLSGRSTFAQSIAKMQEGFTQRTSDLMIIPNYENLPFSRPRKLALATFREMYTQKKFEIINKAGRVYFFEKEGQGRLLFWGTKSIKVPKQFRFIEAWQRRAPSAIIRGQQAIDKTTGKLSQGAFK